MGGETLEEFVETACKEYETWSKRSQTWPLDIIAPEETADTILRQAASAFYLMLDLDNMGLLDEPNCEFICIRLFSAFTSIQQVIHYTRDRIDAEKARLKIEHCEAGKKETCVQTPS